MGANSNTAAEQFLKCFETLFGSVRDPAALIDSSGRILAINPRFEELTKHQGNTLLGQDFRLWCRTTSDCTCPEEKPFGPAVWQGGVELRGAENPYQSLKSPGGLALKGRIAPCSYKNFQGYIFTAWPLGEVAHENKSLQQTRLESLGVLSSSIVHDLNNILTGILGHVSFLRLSVQDEFTDRDSLVAIEDGARKAALLTHQILEFARGEELELGPVDLKQVVKDSLNLLRVSIPPAVSINMSCVDREIFVSGNESQLHQLVLNLTVNARDALPEGGTIDVQLGELNYSDESFCTEHGIAPGDYILLLVRDNGVGIPEEIKSKIFEPFFTTKGGSGTGLGLATVQAIVKAHRGLLTVDSEEGIGTVFAISLPQTALPAQAAAQRSEPRLATGSERILVVDDEETIRTVLQRSLEHLGYEVVTASDGVDAIDQVLDNESGFNLIIVDMIMPRMSGDELFYRLRQLDNSAPVLIASGYASDSRTKAVLRDGALGFIQKPFAIEELAQMVRSCLDRSAKSSADEAAA